MCIKDKYENDIDTSPHAFLEHRCRTWPFPAPGFTMAEEGGSYAAIYDLVRSTGVPNCLGARVPLPTNLNVSAWQRYIDTSTDEADIIDYIKFGFPLGYLGPESPTDGVDNHDSATRFPNHIDQFIAVEKKAGALQGPFDSPPFTPWLHVSPLMTRPKSDPDKRRVITDLTFPLDSSINAYIMKNSALGEVREHTLPSVADLVADLRHAGPSAHLFTVDIARAYKNFSSDPLDWPLLCVKWRDGYYLETSMPFGARASSCFMQRIANFITRVLRSEGIRATMYLDDIVVVAPDSATAHTQYDRVRALLVELGLPEAVEKAQTPSTAVRWLGIDVDAAAMTLAIPHDKVQDALEAVKRFTSARSINKRQLQSLIGKLVHVAKCVTPARIFISHLLQALRAFGDRWYMPVSTDMRADLAWFLEFVESWNGLSLIPAAHPHKSMQVDACLTGVGATDGHAAYAARVAPDEDPIANITEIEAANVVVALHTFIRKEDAGGHIMVQCDNLPAVQAISSGRANNPILAECAHATWMPQAKFAVKISFSHIAGQHNQIADALSRAHTSAAYHALAYEFIENNSLVVVKPCTHVLTRFYPPILSRSGVELAAGPGGGETGTGPSTWNDDGSSGHSGGVGGVLHAIWVPANEHQPGRGMRLDRVSGQQGDLTSDGQEQAVAHQSTPQTSGGFHRRPQPPKSRPGDGRNRPPQRSRAQQKATGPSITAKDATTGNGGIGQRDNGKRSSPPHVLWSVKTIGGGAPWSKQVRPPHTPHEEGCEIGPKSDCDNKRGKKSTTLRPTENRYIIPHRRYTDMPSRDAHTSHGNGITAPNRRTSLRVHGQNDTYANLLPAHTVGKSGGEGGRRPNTLLAAQPKEGISNSSTCWRVFRT